jgi:hypothetical protein
MSALHFPEMSSTAESCFASNFNSLPESGTLLGAAAGMTLFSPCRNQASAQKHGG